MNSKRSFLSYPSIKVSSELSLLRKNGWLNSRLMKLNILRYEPSESNTFRKIVKSDSIQQFCLNLYSLESQESLKGTYFALVRLKKIKDLRLNFRDYPNLNHFKSFRKVVKRSYKLDRLRLSFNPSTPSRNLQKILDGAKSLRMLKSLELSSRVDMSFADKLSSVLSSLAYLESIAMRIELGDRMHRKLFTTISKIEQLKKLIFHFKNELDKDEFSYIIEAVQPLRKLTHFSLTCRIFDINFEEDVMILCRNLSNCTEMAYLKLSLGSTNSVKEILFKDLASNLSKLKNLKFFHFEPSNAYFINDDTFETLGHVFKTLPNLKDLTLTLPLIKSGWIFLNSISNMGLDHLKFNFFGGKITDVSLKAISNTNLVTNLLRFELIIAECKEVTGEGLKAMLMSMKKLKKLSLWVGDWRMEQGPTDELMKSINNGIRDMHDLCSFRLCQEGEISDKSVQNLALVLKNKKNLNKLKIDLRLGHRTSDKSFFAIADAVSNLSKLNNFVFWVRPEPRITSKAVVTLIHQIMKLRNLYKLSLSWRYSSPSSVEEVESLRRKLLSHKKLVELDFGIEKRDSHTKTSFLSKVMIGVIIILGPIAAYKLMRYLFAVLKNFVLRPNRLFR